MIEVAKSSNKRFKAKKTKHVLNKTIKETKLEKLSRKLAAILSHCETQWSVLQLEKVKKRLEEKLKESLRSKDYVLFGQFG